ncbi:hypothetical protein BC830DRAFT_1114364 [Chytriomyces sp. MP71]|nr:hypothetical protein BC830DRAFT_1114364 [Chytriomyces sp. MP71]
MTTSQPFVIKPYVLEALDASSSIRIQDSLQNDQYTPFVGITSIPHVPLPPRKTSEATSGTNGRLIKPRSVSMSALRVADLLLDACWECGTTEAIAVVGDKFLCVECRIADASLSETPTSSSPSESGFPEKVFPAAPTASLHPAALAKKIRRKKNDTAPYICSNCATTETSLWRRTDEGVPICNPCGLYFRLHGKPRVVTNKGGNVIRRRRRLTSSGSNSSVCSVDSVEQLLEKGAVIDEVVESTIGQVKRYFAEDGMDALLALADVAEKGMM